MYIFCYMQRACPYIHLVASYVPQKVRQMRSDCADFTILRFACLKTVGSSRIHVSKAISLCYAALALDGPGSAAARPLCARNYAEVQKIFDIGS